MRRIWGHLFRECLGPTGIGLLAYTFVFLIALIFQLAEYAIRKEIPLVLLGELLALALPRVFLITLPMAILLGILVGMGRLSADAEVTALRASGVSYAQMLPPLLLLGVVGTVLAGTCSLVILPQANYSQHRLNAEIFMAGDLTGEVQPRVFYEEIPDLLVYAEQVDRSEGMTDVLLYQTTRPAGGQLTLARKARIEQQADGGLRIHLQDGETHVTDPTPGRYERRIFGDQVIVRPPDAGMAALVATLSGPLPRKAREMSTGRLRAALREPEGSPEALQGPERLRGEIELHRRFALPLAATIFALLGLPLGLVTRRGGRSSGFAVSLGILLVYWLVFSGGENLARSGVLRPWVAVWTPNLLFLGVGLALLAWLGRERRLPRLLPRLRGRRRSAEISDGEDSPAAGRSRRRAADPGGFPGRIDRYVTSHYVRSLALVLASFLLIFFLGDLRALLDDITGNENLAGGTVARYFAFALPSMVMQGLPLAALLATLLALGLLERNNEITAMKAAGISLYRLSAPLLLVGLLLGAFEFAMTDAVLPRSNQVAADLRAQIRNVRPASKYGLRSWIFGEQRRLYNFASYSQSRDEFLGVNIFRLAPDEMRVVERIEAQVARFRDGSWSLEDGWVRTFDGENEVYRRFDAEEVALPETPDYFRQEIRTPAQMSHAELREHIHDLKRSGYDVQELRVALHEKFSMAAVPLVLVLLGLPFAFRAGRRGAMAGVGLALVVAIVYYFMLAGFRQLGGLGFLPPVLAAWSPDLLFTGVGVYRLLSLDS